ncbi:hypothetical protein CJU89_0958 [Yarrowia sp. B02]|nr:hypothetical protein CJU89_0958 [Yarrowia sp. B02]
MEPQLLKELVDVAVQQSLERSMERFLAQFLEKSRSQMNLMNQMNQNQKRTVRCLFLIQSQWRRTVGEVRREKLP